MKLHYELQTVLVLHETCNPLIWLQCLLKTKQKPVIYWAVVTFKLKTPVTDTHTDMNVHLCAHCTHTQTCMCTWCMHCTHTHRHACAPVHTLHTHTHRHEDTNPLKCVQEILPWKMRNFTLKTVDKASGQHITLSSTWVGDKVKRTNWQFSLTQKV